jgi:CheY-like chemotaxis protein
MMPRLGTDAWMDTLENAGVQAEQARSGSPDEIAAALRAYAAAGIFHVQVWRDPNTITVLEAFAPAGDAFPRLPQHPPGALVRRRQVRQASANSIRLPPQRQNVAADEETSLTMDPLARTQPLVFVTNGDPTFLLMVKELLESEGYAAETMPLVDGPFPEIVRLRPDLLIIDFPYQEQPAWELLDHLDATPVTRTIPMIATSTDRENLAQFAARPMVRTSMEVLLKPYDLDPLVARVTALIPVQS